MCAPSCSGWKGELKSSSIPTSPRMLTKLLLLIANRWSRRWSVLRLLELAHGVMRSDSPKRHGKRQRFLDELMSVVPVHPIAARIGLRAGRIEGQRQREGIRIPLSDLLDRSDGAGTRIPDRHAQYPSFPARSGSNCRSALNSTGDAPALPRRRPGTSSGRTVLGRTCRRDQK